jgi:hypothetical protein
MDENTNLLHEGMNIDGDTEEMGVFEDIWTKGANSRM